MKKSVTKLVLAKETLRELTEGQTMAARGASVESCPRVIDNAPYFACLALETLG